MSRALQLDSFSLEAALRATLRRKLFSDALAYFPANNRPALLILIEDLQPEISAFLEVFLLYSTLSTSLSTVGYKTLGIEFEHLGKVRLTSFVLASVLPEYISQRSDALFGCAHTERSAVPITIM